MAKQLEDAVCGTNKIILKLIDNHKTNYINYWKTYDSNSTSHNIDLDSDQSLKSCVATNLEPGTYYTFQFIDKKKYVLQSRRLRTINLPSIVKLFSDEETMQKDFDEMKKTFSKYQFSEKEVKLGVKSHNILLLGERQSGKSNLLNSLRGIFEGSFQGGISFGGIDESNTLTTFLRKYKFRFTEKIRMFDLFGYYEGSKGFNYSNEFFEELINGNLKDYTTETEWKMVPQENNKDKKRQNDISEEVHSVILVVDACELDQQIIDRHQKMQQDVTTLLNTLNQRGKIIFFHNL